MDVIFFRNFFLMICSLDIDKQNEFKKNYETCFLYELFFFFFMTTSKPKQKVKKLPDLFLAFGYFWHFISVFDLIYDKDSNNSAFFKFHSVRELLS